MTRIRVIADRQICIGSGTCTLVAPHVFHVDSSAHVVVDEHAEVDDTVRAAVADCPVSALSIVEEDE